MPEILFITSYPPRECGIATYSHDLINALQNKFEKSFEPVVCALETEGGHYAYAPEVKYVLNTSDFNSYIKTAKLVNEDDEIEMVMLQHEFGFFSHISDEDFICFLNLFTKPLIITFHTVLPCVPERSCLQVKRIMAACDAVVVMTQNAAEILIRDYDAPAHKISVIPHGIHLVPHLDKNILKARHGFAGRKILSTFGLISSGKSIETTIEALPAIVAQNPDVLFLAIGKTHPEIIRHEGEKYRESLENRVQERGLGGNVVFINHYLPLHEILEYLQMSDIYLFTSKDPDQAVSGTFSYAISCGCPIVSTPIPHAREVLKNGAGLIFDFQNPVQLAHAVNDLLGDEEKQRNFRNNGLQAIVPSAWENIAVKYAFLFRRMCSSMAIQFRKPGIKLDHVKKMTTSFGMMQFSKINQPDPESGYTMDDNARALIAMCMHYKLTQSAADLSYIHTYLDFIGFCQQPAGNFLNYADTRQRFTPQNDVCNLEDANGRAIWALGYLLSLGDLIPGDLRAKAARIMDNAMPMIQSMHSTRAMAFAIKGLCYLAAADDYPLIRHIVETLADRMVNMYRHESGMGWEWFESYLTYGNSILPESMLFASELTGNPHYRHIACESFEFLLSRTFNKDGIRPISNKCWLQKGSEISGFGEQPIDVAYTILALDRFHTVFKKDFYFNKMEQAFNWFLGINHLSQIVYNPCTGGCFDGLEEFQVNLNQGAESTLSYLLARLTIEESAERQRIKYFTDAKKERTRSMLFPPRYSVANLN